MLKSLLVSCVTVLVAACLIGMDPFLLRAHQALIPSIPSLRAAAQWAEVTMDPPVVLGVIVLYVALCGPARWRRLGVLLTTMLSQAALIAVLKKVFSRMRPADLVAQLAFFGPQWSGEHNSFPGGHAAASFAMATVFAAWHPRLRWVFWALAAAITWTRIYLERHYFSDCFVGACLGFWIARSALYYLDPGNSPDRRRGASTEADQEAA